MFEREVKSFSQSKEIGEKLRAIREVRKLSIRSLSEICGLAVNTLSLIENGKTSPSINTIYKIAQALQIPITAFFKSDLAIHDIVFTSISKTKPVKYKYGEFYDLGSNKTTHPIGPFLLKIDPNSFSSTDFVNHPGYEFVFCLKGCLDYVIKEKYYQLEKGDSLLFDSSLPHKWENPSDSQTQVLFLLYPIVSINNYLINHFSENS